MYVNGDLDKLLLGIATAQICQSLGWHGVHKSSHYILTDILERYVKELSANIARCCHNVSRTIPSLEDVLYTFGEMGVNLHELEDYMAQVEPAQFCRLYPLVPVPRERSGSLLEFPSDVEIARREDCIPPHLPPIPSVKLEKVKEEGTCDVALEMTSAVDDSKPIRPCDLLIKPSSSDVESPPYSPMEPKRLNLDAQDKIDLTRPDLKVTTPRGYTPASVVGVTSVANTLLSVTNAKPAMTTVVTSPSLLQPIVKIDPLKSDCVTSSGSVQRSPIITPSGVVRATAQGKSATLNSPSPKPSPYTRDLYDAVKMRTSPPNVKVSSSENNLKEGSTAKVFVVKKEILSPLRSPPDKTFVFPLTSNSPGAKIQMTASPASNKVDDKSRGSTSIPPLPSPTVEGKKKPPSSPSHQSAVSATTKHVLVPKLAAALSKDGNYKPSASLRVKTEPMDVSPSTGLGSSKPDLNAKAPKTPKSLKSSEVAPHVPVRSLSTDVLRKIASEPLAISDDDLMDDEEESVAGSLVKPEGSPILSSLPESSVSSKLLSPATSVADNTRGRAASADKGDGGSVPPPFFARSPSPHSGTGSDVNVDVTGDDELTDVRSGCRVPAKDEPAHRLAFSGTADEAPKKKKKKKDKDRSRRESFGKDKKEKKKKSREDVPAPIPKITLKMGSEKISDSSSKFVFKTSPVASPQGSPSLAGREISHLKSSSPLPAKASSKHKKQTKGKESTKTESKSSGFYVQTLENTSSALGGEVYYCPACNLPDDGSPMIGCDNCDLWYHWPCVQIEVAPEEDEKWFCPKCRDAPAKKKKKKRRE